MGGWCGQMQWRVLAQGLLSSAITQSDRATRRGGQAVVVGEQEEEQLDKHVEELEEEVVDEYVEGQEEEEEVARMHVDKQTVVSGCDKCSRLKMDEVS